MTMRALKTNLSLLLFLLMSLAADAQQNVSYREGGLISPQVNSDNTVTFRLFAPRAKSVVVLADWEANSGKGEMRKGKEGVWEYTSPVLPSEMYTYRFDIDGVVNIDPTNPFTRRDVGNIFSVFFIGGGEADYYQVRDVPHGNLTTTWYHSDELGADRRMSVYTPPFYGKENRSYPVLYLLHGSGGDESAWVELGNTVRIIDNLIAEGKAEPMIVVMPNGNTSKQAAPGESDENLGYRPVMTNRLPGYKDGRYERAFPEIVHFIDATYRTIPDKAHRAIAGLSMGGFQSLYIALNHPGYFDYIGLFSAGLDMSTVDQTLPTYANPDEKLDNLHKAGYKLFWNGCGTADRLYPFCKELDERMRAKGMRTIFHESQRGHLWSNWRQYLLLFTPQIFK